MSTLAKRMQEALDHSGKRPADLARACTKDHWAMIAVAEREELKRKTEAANSRRLTICSGSSMNHGHITTSNTICR